MFTIQKRTPRLMNFFDEFDLFNNHDFTNFNTKPMEITENDNEFNVSVEAPGLSKDDIKISLENDYLKIQGEKKQESKKENEKVHYSGMSYRKFENQIQLTNNVDVDQIEASCKDGILKITIPKKSKEKNKLIKIK